MTHREKENIANMQIHDDESKQTPCTEFIGIYF